MLSSNKVLTIAFIFLLLIFGGCSKNQWVNNGEIGGYDKNAGYGCDIDGDVQSCIIGLMDYGNQGAVEIHEKDDKYGWSRKAFLWCPDGEAGDRFGISVGIDGNFAIVGADDKTGEGSGKGAAYVFEKTETGWEKYYKLVVPDAGYRNYFGRSVDIEGTTAVIGAPYAHSEKGEVGAVYVYEFKDNDWIMTEKLFSSEQNIEAEFGSVIDLCGEWMVIGESRVFSGKNSGNAYIFHKEDNNWKEFQIISLKPEDLDVNFYMSACLYDNELLIGSTQSNRAGYAKCEATLYAFNGNTWEISQELTVEGNQNKETFGKAVSLSGKYAFVSAPGAVIENVPGSGAIYVFKKNKNEWVFSQKLVSDNPAKLDFLGKSVFNTDEDAFVGMPYKLHPENSYLHPGGVLHFSLE